MADNNVYNDALIQTVSSKVMIRQSGDFATLRLVRVSDGQELDRCGTLVAAQARAAAIIAAGGA